jgi:beta-galactosidase
VAADFPAEVAILRSYDALWAFEAQPTAEGFSYDDQVGRYYRALWRRNVAVDLITEDGSWEPYKVLIAPCLFVLREEVSARLHAWVEAGGTLVLSFRSGVKDEYNRVVDQPLPGALRDLAGVHVIDYTALLPAGAGDHVTSAINRLSTKSALYGGPESLELFIDGTTHRAGTDVWMDNLEVNDAEVLGMYRSGPFDGTPAVTLKRFGAGQVIYVGTSLDDVGQALLMGKVLDETGITSGVPSPDNVEIVHRVHEGTDYWFVLNHGPVAQEVRLPARGIELLTGRAITETVIVDGLDVLVVRSQPGV